MMTVRQSATFRSVGNLKSERRQEAGMTEDEVAPESGFCLCFVGTSAPHPV